MELVQLWFHENVTAHASKKLMGAQVSYSKTLQLLYSVFIIPLFIRRAKADYI